MSETISYGAGPEQFGVLRTPEGHEQQPLIVLIHGGFWRDQYRLDLMDPLAEDLHRRGYATWNIEYRRVGPTGGGWDTTTADVAAAIDSIDGPWKTTAVAGHSAGGHLALWNAGRPNPRRAADWTFGLAPVADVIAANRNGVGGDATANFVGGAVDDYPDRYVHIQPDLEAATGRVVLIHGTADDNVPLEQSTAQRERVNEVHVLDGVDHFQVIDPTHETWELVRAELAQL
ncbi:MAG: alpha/beta hydrolase [Actinomycetota bacterium]